VLWKVHSKDHPVAVTHLRSDTLTGSRTPLWRTSLPTRKSSRPVPR